MNAPSPSLRVVDTDVVSFVFKQDTRAFLYQPHLDGKQLVISFMTLAELDRWALRSNWGEARRARLEAYLSAFAVYPSDRALCHEWARVMEAGRRSGRPIQPPDAWIAATAIVCNAPLVTHNPGDYTAVSGLSLITA